MVDIAASLRRLVWCTAKRRNRALLSTLLALVTTVPLGSHAQSKSDEQLSVGYRFECDIPLQKFKAGMILFELEVVRKGQITYLNSWDESLNFPLVDKLLSRDSALRGKLDITYEDISKNGAPKTRRSLFVGPRPKIDGLIPEGEKVMTPGTLLIRTLKRPTLQKKGAGALEQVQVNVEVPLAGLKQTPLNGSIIVSAMLELPPTLKETAAGSKKPLLLQCHIRRFANCFSQQKNKSCGRRVFEPLAKVSA